MMTHPTILSATTTAPAVTWNGGYCQTCGSRYLGHHACTREDILRRIGELTEMLGRVGTARGCDRMSACPCRPENGGSGLCGCILSGPTVTC